MQIRKTYVNLKPELLYDELRDFILNRGPILGDSKFETYSLPNDSSTFISRGMLVFKTSGKECIRVHLVGSALAETKLMLDIDDNLFGPEKTKSLEADLNFMLGGYEAKT